MMNRAGRRRVDRVNGLVEMENVSFAYDTRKEVLHEVRFRSNRNGHSSSWPFWSRKIDDHRIDRGILRAVERVRACGWRGSFDRETELLPERNSASVLQETFLFDGTIRET